jgi:hypothetical protein
MSLTTMSLDLHVGQDGGTSEQSGSTDGTGGHGSSIFGRLATGLGVTGGVLAYLARVGRIASSDCDGGSNQSLVSGSRRWDTGSEGHVAAGRGAWVSVGGLIVGLGAVGGLRGVGGQD